MRDYGAISPRFWTGETGKKLRGHAEAQIVAAYLMSAPGSHMIGLYSLALPTLCHETGLPQEGASKGLARLSEVGFAEYDSVDEVVWVPEMARFQIGYELHGNDKRIKGVENELEKFRKSKFFNVFLDKYGSCFNLKIKREKHKAHASPLEAPWKPLRSQEQDQDRNKTGQDLPPAAPPVLVLTEQSGEKPKKPKAEPAPESSEHARLIAAGAAAFERASGVPYPFAKRDAAHVRDMLTAHGFETAKRLIGLACARYLAEPFHARRGLSFALVLSDATALLTAKTGASPPAGASIPAASREAFLEAQRKATGGTQ